MVVVEIGRSPPPLAAPTVPYVAATVPYLAPTVPYVAATVSYVGLQLFCLAAAVSSHFIRGQTRTACYRQRRPGLPATQVSHFIRGQTRTACPDLADSFSSKAIRTASRLSPGVLIVGPTPRSMHPRK